MGVSIDKLLVIVSQRTRDKDISVLKEPRVIEHNSYETFSFCIFFAITTCMELSLRL